MCLCQEFRYQLVADNHCGFLTAGAWTLSFDFGNGSKTLLEILHAFRVLTVIAAPRSVSFVYGRGALFGSPVLFHTIFNEKLDFIAVMMILGSGVLY